jgi:hypothetical protein
MVSVSTSASGLAAGLAAGAVAVLAYREWLARQPETHTAKPAERTPFGASQVSVNEADAPEGGEELEKWNGALGMVRKHVAKRHPQGLDCELVMLGDVRIESVFLFEVAHLSAYASADGSSNKMDMKVRPLRAAAAVRAFCRATMLLSRAPACVLLLAPSHVFAPCRSRRVVSPSAAHARALTARDRARLRLARPPGARTGRFDPGAVRQGRQAGQVGAAARVQPAHGCAGRHPAGHRAARARRHDLDGVLARGPALAAALRPVQGAPPSAVRFPPSVRASSLRPRCIASPHTATIATPRALSHRAWWSSQARALRSRPRGGRRPLRGPKQPVAASCESRTLRSRAHTPRRPRPLPPGPPALPAQVRAAIVTAGGLCPGLNNIIQGIVRTLLSLYGAESVLGVRGGYQGFDEAVFPPMQLTLETVEGIQRHGGARRDAAAHATPAMRATASIATMLAIAAIASMRVFSFEAWPPDQISHPFAG